VVERVAQQPFTSYVASQVIQPIGASPDELGYVIPDASRHASGYLEKYSLMNLAKRLLIAPDSSARIRARGCRSKAIT